jgi:hypothetical protein
MKMGKSKWLSTLRLLMGLVVLFIGSSLCLAQENGNANSNGQVKSNAQSKQAGPPAGCKAGKMRCLNNKNRWDAAIRNADRRATELRKHHGEVKQ